MLFNLIGPDNDIYIHLAVDWRDFVQLITPIEAGVYPTVDSSLMTTIEFQGY